MGGSAWSLTNEVRYIYDGRVVIQERDGSNNPKVTYTRGLDLSLTREGAGGIGGLLARTDASGSAYYHCDAQGNVTCMLDGNNNVVARYRYDPYGNILAMNGSLASANLYRFSSKEYHPNSGLVYYLYRYYEPGLQRWVNRDPIEERGGFNLYGNVQNDPFNNIDPFGLKRMCDESFNDCRERCLAENYGKSYEIAKDFSWMSIPSVVQEITNRIIEKQAAKKIKDLALSGAKESGTIIDKMNAAEKGAKATKSLSRVGKALGLLSKLSGIVAAPATGYVIGANLYCAFDCSD